MRYSLVAAVTLISIQMQAQSIVGTWQLTDEKTCFQSELKEGDTEIELLKDMGGSSNGVARIIRFEKKGSGEDGIFATGLRKAADMSAFKYKINGQEIMMLDNKSGIMTQHLIIDELSQSTLRVHNAKKECETKTFLRLK